MDFTKVSCNVRLDFTTYLFSSVFHYYRLVDIDSLYLVPSFTFKPFLTCFDVKRLLDFLHRKRSTVFPVYYL